MKDKLLKLFLATAFSLHGSPPAPTISYQPGEYWVSPIATGSALTTGSQANPLDGSTQPKFDALMQAMPPYALIHLMPGNFQTLGDTKWGPKTGQVIVGSGMYLTTLQFPAFAVATGSLNLAHVIKPLPPYMQFHITVQDLTVDCNGGYIRTTNETLNGISLTESGNTIKNVQCLNTASFTASNIYVEAWGIFCASPFSNAIGNRIEGCVVSGFTGNNHNNLSAMGLLGNNSGWVINNEIDQTGTNSVIGIYPGSHDSIVEGNITRGVMLGSHYDNGTGVTNVSIIGNHFINCNTAIDWANGRCQGVKFANNIITLTNTTGLQTATVQAFFFHPAPSSFYNLQITGNMVGIAPHSGPHSSGPARFIFAYGVHGMTVSGNSVDPQLTNYFDSTCDGVIMNGNFDLVGNPSQTVLP